MLLNKCLHGLLWDLNQWCVQLLLWFLLVLFVVVVAIASVVVDVAAVAFVVVFCWCDILINGLLCSSRY